MNLVLICGSGSIAFRHYLNLKKLGYDNIIFFSKNNNLLKNINKPIFKNIDKALANKPNIAFICNNTSDHIKISVKCAIAKCNLFIEKPISHNLADISILKKLIKKNKLISHVGYMMRYHPLLIKLKKIVDKNEFGKLTYLRSIWGEDLKLWHPYENYTRSYAGKKKLGGGPLITLSHDFDTILWLFGDFKKSALNNNKSSTLKIDTDHAVDILINFKNRATGNINLNYIQNPPKRIFELTFTKGYIEFDYYKNSLSLFKNGKLFKKYEIKKFEKNIMFINEIKYFLNKVKINKFDLNMINSSEKILKNILK